MKSLMAMILCLGLIVGGCSQIKTVTDYICNPTAEQQATADAMLKALDAAQAAGVIFVPALDVLKASSVLKAIRTGGCFFVKELAEAFKVVDAANAGLQNKTNSLMKVAKAKPVMLPQYPALRVYVIK